MAATLPSRHVGRVPLRISVAVAVVAATLWACLENAAAASNAAGTRCDAGWTYLPLVGTAGARCYVLSSTADTRVNASVGCRGRGGAELLALRTRAAVTSALALFAVDAGTASSSVVSLLDYAVYANGTVVDHNGDLVVDCSVCANVSLAPGRAQPACLVAGLAIGGTASANAFVQDTDCSQSHTYLCSKPPTSGASSLDVKDSMAIFCTVFILVNFIFFNGYFLLSDYFKNHPHHGPVSTAPAITDGAGHAVDRGVHDTKKAPVSDRQTQLLEQPNPYKLQQLQVQQEQDGLLHIATVAASRSSSFVQSPRSASSGEALLSAEAMITAAATPLPARSIALAKQTGAITAADDYAETACFAAEAVREAALALDRVSTPRYQPPRLSSTSDFERSMASANVSETVTGLTSSGGEILVRPTSSNQIVCNTEKSNDFRETGTSRQSLRRQDDCSFDDPVTVSTGVETNVTQRNAAVTGVPGRASSAASTQLRQTPLQQPAKLARTFSRSAAHLR